MIKKKRYQMGKPFSKTELKMMVYRRTQDGMPYEEAVEEVAELIKQVKKNRSDKNKKDVGV